MVREGVDMDSPKVGLLEKGQASTPQTASSGFRQKGIGGHSLRFQLGSVSSQSNQIVIITVISEQPP